MGRFVVSESMRVLAQAFNQAFNRWKQSQATESVLRNLQAKVVIAGSQSGWLSKV